MKVGQETFKTVYLQEKNLLTGVKSDVIGIFKSKVQWGLWNNSLNWYKDKDKREQKWIRQRVSKWRCCL